MVRSALDGRRRRGRGCRHRPGRGAPGPAAAGAKAPSQRASAPRAVHVPPTLQTRHVFLRDSRQLPEHREGLVGSCAGGGGARARGFVTQAAAAWGREVTSLNVAWNQNRNLIFGTEPTEPRGRHSALELEEPHARWNWTRGGPVSTAGLPGSDSGAAASPLGSRPDPQGWQVALVPSALVGVRGRHGARGGEGW